VSEQGPALSPAELVEALIVLTETLDARLKTELAAFEAHRPHEVAASVGETQRLAEAYRRETARVKADPGLIASAPLARRKRLAEITRAFDETVRRHRAAAEAAKRITDGLVRTIAGVVVDRRKPAAGYGPRANPAAADARAIALNRRA
jgi:hypothetical protein